MYVGILSVDLAIALVSRLVDTLWLHYTLRLHYGWYTVQTAVFRMSYNDCVLRTIMSYNDCTNTAVWPAGSETEAKRDAVNNNKYNNKTMQEGGGECDVTKTNKGV